MIQSVWLKDTLVRLSEPLGGGGHLTGIFAPLSLNGWTGGWQVTSLVLSVLFIHKNTFGAAEQHFLIPCAKSIIFKDWY